MAWRLSVPSVYRALLYAYPAEFREEYGEEMERTVAERRRSGSRTALFVSLLLDVLVSAPREHAHILVRDLRYTVRVLAKAPGFVVTALLALGLGVGAAVTVFSVVNAVLIRSLPYADADRLVYMWTPLPRYRTLPREYSPSFPDVLAWRASSRSFTEITAFRQRVLTLETGGDPIRVSSALVLGNFFQTLGTTPLLGRVIDPNDTRPDQPGVVVIGYNLWSSQYHQDPAIIGRDIRLGFRSLRVIGVMGPDFGFPHETDFATAMPRVKQTEAWAAMALTPEQQSNRLSQSDAAIGRLRPGVSLRQAQSEVSAIQKGLDPLNLPEMRGTESYLAALTETAVGPVRTLMRLLSGAVILVLLIACGNVSSLLMARAVSRSHEMGVRTAMGAPRSRLLRQLLTESLLVSTAGGALGTLAAWFAVGVVARLNPSDIPRFEQISVDGRVLAFALLVSALTGLVFGILPAFTASRTNIGDLLRQGGGRGIAGGGARSRSIFIVADVALAVVLLTGAGLLIRSYRNVQGADKGFAASTLTMRIAAAAPGRTDPQIATLCRSIVERVAAVPGIAYAGVTSALPLSRRESRSTFTVEGYANVADQLVDARDVAGSFFQAMQIRLIDGRYFTGADLQARPKPTIVSESFARIYFPGGAVGHRLQRGRQADEQSWSTVVGVVADVRDSDLEKEPQPTMYQPAWQDYLAVRTSVPPATAIASIRKAVREVDPAIALANIETMRDRMTEMAARRRFQTIVLTAFAGIAMLLVLVGLYGLLAYTVRQRSPEIGIRMALGAGRGTVMAMIVGHGLRLTFAGLGIGLAGSAVAARWMSSLLYQVGPVDRVTFLAVPGVMLAAAAVACIVPAWKATRIDPVASLRQ